MINNMINNKLIIKDNMTEEQKDKAFKEWLEVEQHNDKVRAREVRNWLICSSVICIAAGLISYFGCDATLIQACAITIGTFIFLVCA